MKNSNKKLVLRASCLLLMSFASFAPAGAKMNQMATQYFVLGLNWQRKGNLAEAESALKKALSFSSNDADLHASLAQVLFLRDKTDESLAEFAKATSLEPSNSRTHLLYGNALKKSKHINEAIQEFQIAAQLEANYPFIHFNLGEAYSLAGRDSEAIAELQIALSDDPSNLKALYLIANSQHKLGQLTDAIGTYQKVLSLKPEHEAARLNLARAYDASNNLDAAEREYLTLLNEFPRRSDLLSALADLRFRKGDLNGAVGAATKALQIQPDDSTLHAMLGAYKERQNDWQTAVNHYQTASELEKDPAKKNQYLVSSAQILFKKGNYNKASQLIENVLSQDPNNASLKSQLADIRLWQKQYTEAVYLYREVLTAHPEFSSKKQLLFNYGAALNGIKDWTNAELVWNNYLKLDKKSKEAWLNLASAQLAQKKIPETISSYQGALANGANKQNILNQIGPLQVQINDWNNAEATYRELVNLNPTQTKNKITLSRVLAKQGKQEEAIRLLREAGGNSNKLQLELAERIAASGDYYSAATEYQKVLADEPNNTEAIIGLADSYSAIGQYSEASKLYKKYLGIAPDNFHAQYNLALALANMGKEAEAATEYRKAIDMNPGFAESYYGLGAVLLSRDAAQSRDAWRRYLDLQPQGEYKSEILHHFPDLK